MIDVGVVGGGPAGIILAWRLLEEELSVELIDSNSRLGGIWAADRADSPVYPNLHLITSALMTGLTSGPKFRSGTDYPPAAALTGYVSELGGRVSDASLALGQEATRFVRTEDEGWVVETPAGTLGEYRCLVLATGISHSPMSVRISGGTGLSVVDVRTAMEEYADATRVAVVGSGNSAADALCFYAERADRLIWARRSTPWFVPKYFADAPSDYWSDGYLHSTGRDTQASLRSLLLESHLPLRRTGAGFPNHAPLERAPVIGQRLLPYLVEDWIECLDPPVAVDGNLVTFGPGARRELDLLVVACGYDERAHLLTPFSDTVFGPVIGTPVSGGLSLFSLRLPNSDIGGYWILDHLSCLIARQCQQICRRKPLADLWSSSDLSNGVQQIQTDDVTTRAPFAHGAAFLRETLRLAKRLGVILAPPPEWSGVWP